MSQASLQVSVMSRSSPRGSSGRGQLESPHAVIPPIIANEADRTFLINLNSYIDHELSKIDKTNPTQRYIIYKSAFDRIIDYVNAYKPLLTAIKLEYEDTIETIERGQREASFLAGKVKAMTTELSTIHNYRKRADDLDQKLSVIKTDNERLQDRLQELRSSRQQQTEQRQLTSESEHAPHEEPEKDHRHIPGLSVKQSTDVAVLEAELEGLEAQLKELRLSQKTRYMPKDTKARLKEQLTAKVAMRDEVAKQLDIMKQKRQKLKVAVESAHAWMKIQPPVQTIGEAIVTALSRANRHGGFEKTGEDGLHRATPSTTFEEDDPGREKEAEAMLEYIEKFNELMEDELYEEAAVHAANSPKSILRTPETLNRFKTLKVPHSPSPLLVYCEALMSTVPAYKMCPNEYMSQEAIRCALRENRQDLLAYWIAQDRLTLTEQIGDEIFAWAKSHRHSSAVCLALAQQVYAGLNLHRAAAGCMVRQGRVNQAVEYASQRHALSSSDYCTLLHVAPSLKLGCLLAERSLLPLGAIYNVLKGKGMAEVGLQVILHLHCQHRQDVGKNSHPLRDAVFADKDMPYEQWEHIASKLSDGGNPQVAMEVLAAATVFNSIQIAARRVHGLAELAEEERPADPHTPEPSQ